MPTTDLKRPDRRKCRWLDRYFGDVCRNEETHPSRIFAPGTGVVFIEPGCDPCEGCGFEAITPETPAWDAKGGKEEVSA